MWRANRATISAILDEGQLEFQFLQKFAFLLRHRSAPVDGKSNVGFIYFPSSQKDSLPCPNGGLKALSGWSPPSIHNDQPLSVKWYRFSEAS
jgi:hypothetical protein